MVIDREGGGVVPSRVEQLIVSFGVQNASSGEEWSSAQYLAQKSKFLEWLET